MLIYSKTFLNVTWSGQGSVVEAMSNARFQSAPRRARIPKKVQKADTLPFILIVLSFSHDLLINFRDKR